MLKTIILFSTMLTPNLRHVDKKVELLIYESTIPPDCKKLFLALTIFESNWHNNYRAILTNNYSGFMKNGKLKKFKSLEVYQRFVEIWFKKKHIKNRKQFVSLILQGKYANLSKTNCKKYLSKLVCIEKTL